MQVNQFTLDPYLLVTQTDFPLSLSGQVQAPVPSNMALLPQQKQLLSEGLLWPKTASSLLFLLLETAFLPAEEHTLYIMIKTTIINKIL